MSVSRNTYQVARLKKGPKLFLINILACSLWLAACGLCCAQDLVFEATVNKNRVSLGQSIQLSLTFNDRDIPAIELSDIEGFKSRYLGPSTKVSMVNGKVTSSITHIYTLVAVKEGAFTLGPFLVNYEGKTYASKPIAVEVAQGSAQESQMDLEDRVFTVMEIEKTKVYLNELTPVSVKLYVDNLSVRNIQFPQFGHEGFSADKFGQGRQYRENLSGVSYDVIEFKTNIFGIRPGEFILGPARVRCNLAVRKQRRSEYSFFGDFFGRYEVYPLDLKSAQIPVTVLVLPEEKPDSFEGAIGNFDFGVEINLREVKVGDPITLKMVVSGEGNFNTVNAPKLGVEKDFKIYESQVKVENNKKVFERILMPKTDMVKEIPEIKFSFFNPKDKEYKIITKGPLPINVIALEKEEKVGIIEYPYSGAKLLKKEELGRGIIYIKEAAGPLKRKGAYLFRNKKFLFAQTLPLIFLLLFLTVYKRAEKIKTDVKYARRLAAPKKAKAGIKKARQSLEQGQASEFYNGVFKVLREYLGDKFHLSAAGITVEVVDEVLKSKGIEEGILAKIEELFKDCDMARYAPSEFSGEKMKESLKKLEETMDYLQRKRI